MRILVLTSALLLSLATGAHAYFLDTRTMNASSNAQRFADPDEQSPVAITTPGMPFRDPEDAAEAPTQRFDVPSPPSAPSLIPAPAGTRFGH